MNYPACSEKASQPALKHFLIAINGVAENSCILVEASRFSLSIKHPTISF